MKDEPMPNANVDELLFSDFDISRRWGVPYDASNAICAEVTRLRACVAELEAELAPYRAMMRSGPLSASFPK